jgi:hypothetical protein
LYQEFVVLANGQVELPLLPNEHQQSAEYIEQFLNEVVHFCNSERLYAFADLLVTFFEDESQAPPPLSSVINLRRMSSQVRSLARLLSLLYAAAFVANI